MEHNVCNLDSESLDLTDRLKIEKLNWDQSECRGYRQSLEPQTIAS